MDCFYLGQIIMFAGNYAPKDWALCNGQFLSIGEYGALYSILGTAYGGDGRTTFALPNLKGRVPLHPVNVQQKRIDGRNRIQYT
jgi:microcystin-dependent protein